LALYFSDSMQTVYVCGGGGDGSQQRGRRWGRCSIYRHCSKSTIKRCLNVEIHHCAIR